MLLNDSKSTIPALANCSGIEQCKAQLCGQTHKPIQSAAFIYNPPDECFHLFRPCNVHPYSNHLDFGVLAHDALRHFLKTTFREIGGVDGPRAGKGIRGDGCFTDS